MENPRAIFQVLLALSFFIIISATNDCPVSEYKLNKSYPKHFSIRFPFKFQNQTKNCGYPGFDLTITPPENTATLSLPNSGQFSVRDIDYVKQQIQLYDPLGCLPKRLTSLNLSSSPFTVSYYRNYTFLNCSPEAVAVSKSSAVDCLSNSTATVVAASSLPLAREMNTCAIVFEKAIPVRWPDQNDSLTGDLTLSWNLPLPGCVDCEKKGNICGFANGTSSEIACFDAPKSGLHHRAFYKGLLVVYVVGVTAFLCTALYCHIEEGERKRRLMRSRRALHLRQVTAIPEGPAPHVPTGESVGVSN